MKLQVRNKTHLKKSGIKEWDIDLVRNDGRKIDIAIISNRFTEGLPGEYNMHLQSGGPSYNFNSWITAFNAIWTLLKDQYAYKDRITSNLRFGVQ